MTGPQDPAVAGGDQFRAGHADREQVIEALKAAFTQGRLTEEELDARAGQALAARTYAELGAVTADIPGAPPLEWPPASPVLGRAGVAGPPGLARAGVAGPPGLTRRRPLARAAAKSGGFLVIAAVLVHSGNIIANSVPNGLVLGSLGPYQAWTRVLLLLGLALAVTALVILGRGVAASAEQRRSRRKLPPRPRLGDHALEAGPHEGVGHDLVPPGPGIDQTRAEPRTPLSWPHRSPSSWRGARVPRGIRPVSDAM
jgi:hypothetical protein